MNTTDAPVTPALRRWLVFRIAAQAYAAPLECVGEVIRDGDATPVPGAAPELLGIRHLRGRIVPVLDGARRVGLAPDADADPEQARIVVLVHGAHRIGLRVDAVGELLESTQEPAPPPPGRVARDDDPVEGVLPLQSGFVALLDVRRLCRLAG
ncbi:chemotaxis protein CheW [Fulvimonas sp. R45]|uniref:chemotaxis protein CheW n=1 Tax=Fulvimonas sp. R45 TaxID=3045937 RepID=UPI00265E68DE|nr:chemotaxis protein CheW [Fulvimonas sp. R45]MDO1528376.1 chemotaxis protein CheW [Fulvimonas sp. R45]